MTEEEIDAKIWEVINDPALTIQVKASLLSGVSPGSSRAIGRSGAGATYTTAALEANQGIPSISFYDGPIGINHGYKATGWCSPTAVASTWSVDATHSLATQIGKEAVYYGIDFMLGPAHDLLRNPLSGRNFEYYSEDPTLSGKIAAAYTQGQQSQGVGVDLKHFAANEQESFGNGPSNNDLNGTNVTNNTGGGNVVATERSLREIYFKSFEIPVREANPWGVMASYATINGRYAADNKWLLTDILRGEWGFKGLVTSDWNANSTPPRSIIAQLDLMMPNGSTTVIVNAVNNNINGVDATYPELTLDVLNRGVFNVLKGITRTNTFRGVYGTWGTSRNTATLHTQFYGSDLANESNTVARKVAQESFILLKNDNNALPLDPATEKVGVVSSPNLRYYAAWGASLTSTSDFVVRGGGSSIVYIGDTDTQNYWYTSPDNPNKIYSLGTVLSNRGLLSGTVQDIYQAAGRTKTVNYTRSGTGVAQRTTGLTLGYSALPTPVVWNENLNSAAKTMADSDASAGIMIISRQTGEGYDNNPVKTNVNTTYDTRTSGVDANTMNLSRSYYLSDVEEASVKAYADALHAKGKKFIVLLNVGAAIDTTFIDQYADAILVVWYPGQDGANAMADVLYGAVSPSGKTTQTFLQSFIDSPSVAAARALPQRDMSAVYAKNEIANVKNPASPIFTNAGWATNPVFYDEGVLVGYRWFDTKFKTEEEYNEHVAYPFGHGLSYTSFEFSNLRLSKPLFNLANGGDETITATVSVKNTGSMAGKEVVQMYIGMENYASEGRPMKDLRAFDKVELAPGESKNVSFEIKLNDLQYFDDKRDPDLVLDGTYAGYTRNQGNADASNVEYGLPGSGWKVTPGSMFNVIIGDTSNNFVLERTGVQATFKVIETLGENPMTDFSTTSQYGVIYDGGASVEPGSILIIAQYDAVGRLVDVVITEVAAVMPQIFMADRNVAAATARAFIWNAAMAPLAESVTLR